MSLRVRLAALLALAVVVPLVATGSLVVRELGHELESRAYQRLETARGAAVALLRATQVHDAERAATAARLLGPDVLAGATDLAVRLEQARLAGGFDLLLVVGGGGRVLGSSRGPARFAAGIAPPSDADLLARPTQPTVLVSAAPVVDPAGRPAAEVLAGTWVDGDLLDGVARSLDVSLAVVGNGGLVASTRPLGRVPVLAGDERFRADLGGRDSLVVAGPVPGLGGRLLVSTAAGPVLRLRSNVVVALLVALAVVLVALAGAVSWASARVVGPIRALADAARGVARGEVGRRVEVRSPPEAAELAGAFNTMTDHLEEHARALEESRTGFRRALDRLGDALAATDDRDAIVDVILDTSRLTLDAEIAVLYAAVSSRSGLRAWAAAGVDTEGLVLDPGAGVAGWSAAHDAVVVWPGGPTEPAPLEPVSTSAIGVPFHSRGRLIGVVTVYVTDPDRRLTDDDAVTLASLVRQAETAIDNIVLHEEARQLAITDGLTGVWNRRHLDLRAVEELRRARRFGEPFAVVMVDIDDFKAVNDRYGHQAGDAVLVELAGRLTNVTREVDTVARYGGEEFALLLPHTDLGGASRLADKARAAVAGRPFTIDAGQVGVTVSVGVARHPANGSTVAQLIGAADAAMYRAKAAGKNRVEWAGDKVPEGSGGT